MAAHGRALLRVANRWSLCHDDAMDAYQRALEIFLRRVDSVDAATEVAWLKVVIKHEALAIRRSRSSTVGGSEDVDPDEVVVPGQRSVEERLASSERIERGAEALRALKPDEARALMLKAEGLSYAEIGERCGWSYTKVNRAITEGRRRFLEVFRAIESGDACERYAGTLAALAGGTASSAEIVEIRPHLRHCMACRATVRELHVSRLAGLQLVVPGALLGPLAWLANARGPHVERIKSAEETLREAPTLQVPTATPTPDPGAFIDPDALEGALGMGGHVVVPLDLPERIEHARRLPRLGRVREEAIGLLNRSSSSDIATGIHIASTGGGGRIATVATIIGFCVSGVGAGALCVATGVVQAPRWILHREARPAPPRPLTSHQRSKHAELARPPRSAELLQQPKSADPRLETTTYGHRAAQVARRRRSAAGGREQAAQAQATEFGFETGAAGVSPTSHPSAPRRVAVATRRTQQTTTDPAQEEFGP